MLLYLYNGDDRFSTPVALKSLNGFRWNLEYTTTSGVRPPMQLCCDNVHEWSWRTSDMSQLSVSWDTFSIFFLIHSCDRASPVQMDGFWRYMMQGYALWGLVDIPFLKCRRNHLFRGMNTCRRFQAQKRNITTTIADPIKFCTMTKTGRYPSRVVPKCAPNPIWRMAPSWRKNETIVISPKSFGQFRW